jgi:hypothetical protein
MLALLISMASYAILVLIAGATAVRDASGIVGDVANGTEFDCFPERSCDWGLMNSYSVSRPVHSDVGSVSIWYESSLICGNTSATYSPREAVTGDS